MKKALAEEKSPLDACLESVLPGVHQWHHANNAAIATLRNEMRIMTLDMKVGISQIVEELQQTRIHRSEQDVQLASLLEMGRQVLLTGKPLDECGLLSTPPRTRTSANTSTTDAMLSPISTPNNDDATTNKSNDANELEKHKSFMMRPKHKNLSDLLLEWIGVGDFNDGFGGIEGRNKKFGPSWRQHFSTYSYSRTERTVKGIRAFSKQKAISDFDACRELEPVFQEQRCSVTNMVNYFTSSGLLTKRKPRGKINRTVSPSPPN
jgi:hypothetical protein